MMHLYSDLCWGGDLAALVAKAKADHEQRATRLASALDAAEAELDRAERAYKKACAKAIEEASQ